jgi:hypothetical protein
MTDDPYDTKPDWTRWEDETLRGYLLRLISQAVWVAGDAAVLAGDRLRVKLWHWSDLILDYAYPQQPPVEIDLGAGANGSEL